MSIKDLLIDFDVWVGGLISLEQPLTTVDRNLDVKKKGVQPYSVDEWKITRTKGYNKIGQNGEKLENNEKYFNHMVCEEKRKLFAALSLVHSVDLGKYRSIFEIGCGEMMQAFIVKQYFPNIRYLATDIDPYIIEKCSCLTILDSIEKGVYNVLKDSPETFRDFGLIISWGVEYVIDSANLLKLLCSAKKYSIPVLICTQQIIGPMRYVSRKIKTNSFDPQRLSKEGVRLHGWVRTIRYWKRAAEGANMRLEVLKSPSTQIGNEANYHWLLFNP